MITKGIERLDEMLRQPEVRRINDVVGVLEDMGHLESHSLNQALCVLCQVLIFRIGFTVVRGRLHDLLDLLQGIHTSSRIVAQNVRDHKGDIISGLYWITNRGCSRMAIGRGLFGLFFVLRMGSDRRWALHDTSRSPPRGAESRGEHGFRSSNPGGTWSGYSNAWARTRSRRGCTRRL